MKSKDKFMTFLKEKKMVSLFFFFFLARPALDLIFVSSCGMADYSTVVSALA